MIQPTRLLAATITAGALVAAAAPEAQARDGEGIEDTRKILGETSEQDDKKGWQLGTYGYVRASYEHVQEDPNVDFVGRNSGFVAQHARLGFAGWNDVHGISFRIAIEGASDLGNPVNSPQAQLDVRLRDAFIRYDPSKYVGVQLGQFKAPLAEEELRGNMALMFSDRAVGVQGVAVGRGYEQQGLEVDRQLGLMIAPAKPIGLVGELGVAYYLMVANGNGANQSLNDNNSLALIGRLEFNWGDMVLVGAGVMHNARTRGDLPNLVEETDFTLAADLLVTLKGFEFFTQLVQRTTSYETVSGTPDREQRSWHAQLGYEIDLPVPLMPAYRFATYDPWLTGGGTELESLALRHHTLGLRVTHPERSLGLSLYLNYTFTQEEDPRVLENNRFEALAQLIF